MRYVLPVKRYRITGNYPAPCSAQEGQITISKKVYKNRVDAMTPRVKNFRKNDNSRFCDNVCCSLIHVLVSAVCKKVNTIHMQCYQNHHDMAIV